MTLSDPHAKADMRDASSVILYRLDPLEVYLIRRPARARFFPDHWSLPGGAVDEEDGPKGSLEAFRRAALRELGEELHVEVPDGLAERVIPAGRAVTPPFHTIRFNAQYFLVPCPEGWEPEPDPDELADGAWFRPQDALDQWERGEIKLPPPILYVVRQMAQPGGLFFLSRLGNQVHDFPIELAPGLRMVPLEVTTLPPARFVNCFVMGRRELAVVDPGATGDHLQPLVEQLDGLVEDGCSVEAVILTHHHEDHAAGAAEIAERYDAMVSAHPDAATHLDPKLVEYSFNEGIELALDVDTDLEIVLRAAHTPGHAPGHIALWVDPLDALLAGDLVSTVSTVIIPPDDGDMAAYMASLERCIELAPDAVFPAHGPPTLHGVKLLQDTLDHRREREQLVVQALSSEPRHVDALVEIAYQDKPPEVWPLAKASLEAHLIKLEADGVAARSEDGWLRTAKAPTEAPVKDG